MLLLHLVLLGLGLVQLHAKRLQLSPHRRQLRGTSLLAARLLQVLQLLLDATELCAEGGVGAQELLVLIAVVFALRSGGKLFILNSL